MLTVWNLPNRMRAQHTGGINKCVHVLQLGVSVTLQIDGEEPWELSEWKMWPVFKDHGGLCVQGDWRLLPSGLAVHQASDYPGFCWEERAEGRSPRSLQHGWRRLSVPDRRANVPQFPGASWDGPACHAGFLPWSRSKFALFLPLGRSFVTTVQLVHPERYNNSHAKTPDPISLYIYQYIYKSSKWIQV